MTLDEIIKRDKKSNKNGVKRGRANVRGGPRGRAIGRFRGRPNGISKRRDDRFPRGGRINRGSTRFNTVKIVLLINL